MDREALLKQLGDPYTNEVVKRFHRFVFVPPKCLESLAIEALSENWGANRYVLEKYLAVHVAWSIEQGRFSHSSNQFYTTAGHLQTRYGTPLYLVFAKNNANSPPWRIVMSGSQISAPELPTPPDIPSPPELPRGAEVVM